MQDIITSLEAKRAEARKGGGKRRIDAQHEKRETDGSRANRCSL